MSHFDDDFRRPSPRTLYRDKQGGKLFGVFAGIADYFGFQKGPTQLVGFVLCLTMPPLIAVYIVLGIYFACTTRKPLYQSIHRENVEII